MSVTIAGGVVRRQSLEHTIRSTLETDEHLLVRKHDIVYNMMRMWQGAAGIAKEDGVVSPAYVVCRPLDGIDPLFAHHLFRTPRMIYLFWAYSHGLTDDRRRLYFDDFARVPIPLPRVQEQQTIADLLSKWDSAIDQTVSIIEAKDRRRQGLVHQLLTGQRRFPEFRGQKRTSTRLGAVLTKISNGVEVDPLKIYQEIGIRSHGKGVFHKDPVQGTSLGEKRVFEVVPGCLTLNIVFAWERALAVTTENEVGMIASHRFPMFRPDPDRVSIEFVLHYMLSDVGHNVLKLASPGGAGRNRTISQEQFLKTKIPLPSLAEQHRIVECINSADLELRSFKRYLDALRKQKRGLMQKLLTGEVRVPHSLLKKGAKS